jgi:hypothetical protein
MSESVLGRWSRRKLEARTETEAPPPPPPEPVEDVVAEAPPPEEPELPSIDSLEAGSDYSAFLRPGVPAELRQQALSRLWATNPALMQPEVMDLHMGDYTTPVVAEMVKTAWRLGKGVLDAAELADEEAETRKAEAAARGENNTQG